MTAKHATVPQTDAPKGRTFSKKGLPYLLLLPGMAWLTIFFIVPLVSLFFTSLETLDLNSDFGEYKQAFRFQNYVDALTSPQTIKPLTHSFVYALLATILALLIAYPLAYAIAFRAGKAKNVLLVLVVAPFFVSFLLRTVAWRQILGDEGPVITVLQTIGLMSPNSSIYPSAFSVVMGLVYNFLPFMTLPVYAALERLDPRLIEAANDLYSNGFTAFRKVTWPLSLPGVVAGTLLTFIPAAGDYVNSSLLGNQNTAMIGNRIDGLFLVANDYPQAAVLSFVLMIAILVPVLIYVRKAGTEELV